MTSAHLDTFVRFKAALEGCSGVTSTQAPDGPSVSVRFLACTHRAEASGEAPRPAPLKSRISAILRSKVWGVQGSAAAAEADVLEGGPPCPHTAMPPDVKSGIEPEVKSC